MKLLSISVLGLFDKSEDRTFVFHDDINILTGRNGSGKTTIMKLAWFIMSGNIIHALKEIKFKSCTIKTDIYKCTVNRTGPVSCRVIFESEEFSETFEDQVDDDGDFYGESAEDQANPNLSSRGGSIFFPTFRRIEGGFTLGAASTDLRPRPGQRSAMDIDNALSSLSKNLSNLEHLFVAAISTQDISGMLLRQYASLSDEVNRFQEEISRTVISKIVEYQNKPDVSASADALLAETRVDIEKIENFRAEKMTPFEAVTGITERLFKHSGISFGRRLSFGDAAAAINSDFLSAGEKQMLSFICYNAFHRNKVIFIDEPELSLHVDWQRQLYSILDSQGASNQFIFATHSPFIYSKYPDKEVLISNDRGD